MYPVVPSSSRRRPLFPPLPEDPISDSPLTESEIISRDSSSSDDETEKAAKRRRMLKHAESYLRGEPLYLHSARLRGPVVKNPWGKVARQVKRKNSGEREGERGTRKRLKRCNANVGEDGREILPTPSQPNKGKGILTSREANTIGDMMPEALTPTSRPARSLAAANVPDLSRSHSPVLGEENDRNCASDLDRRDSPFDISKQTDDEHMAIFKTPVKRKPARVPIEPPPACSPGTFYSGPRKSKNPTLSLKTAVPQQRSVSTSYSPQTTVSTGTSYSPPLGYRGSSSKSAPSLSTRKTSARKKPMEKEVIADTIIVAEPTPIPPDVDPKKRRPKIDFAAKSPFVKPAPERAKPPKGRKKKRNANKEGKVTEPQPGPVLEADAVGLVGLENGVERIEDTIKDPIKDPAEQVLSDWINRHVAASQSVQILDSVASKNSPNANNISENPNPTTSTPLTKINIASIPIPDSRSITAKSIRIAGVPILPLEEVPSLPIDTVTLPNTLQTPSLLEATAVKPPQQEPKKASSLPPDSKTTTIPQLPTRQPQSPKASEQALPEATGSEPPPSEAEEQLQSQAASWGSTQYQVRAAEKGFFDALKDSPVVYGPLSTETPGRDLLRPISFFDNEPGVAETPQLGNNRAVNNKNMTSPSKNLGFTGTNTKWGNGGRLDDRDSFISPFRSTFGEGGQSPPGTAFTPFRAFATPESSPKRATQRKLNPLTFSSLNEPTQQPETSTKKMVKFGFGLLDDEDEDEDEPTDGSFGSGFSPVGVRIPGQQGMEEGQQLVETVMGFMGGGVWDIDEELRKMSNTPDATASTPGTGRKGKGRESSAKKRRFFARKTEGV